LISDYQSSQNADRRQCLPLAIASHHLKACKACCDRHVLQLKSIDLKIYSSGFPLFKGDGRGIGRGREGDRDRFLSRSVFIANDSSSFYRFTHSREIVNLKIYSSGFPLFKGDGRGIGRGREGDRDRFLSRSVFIANDSSSFCRFTHSREIVHHAEPAI
jgi:hypothetical protein